MRKFIKSIKALFQSFKRNWKRALIAFGIMILLQIGDYFITNATYPLFDSLDSLIWYDYFFKKGDAPDENVLYFNVSYDKQLVPTFDEFGDTIGQTPITNRKLLAQFLNLLKDIDYKYIFLDIRFEEGTESENDSMLFSIMNKLGNFSFSTHRNIETLIPDTLISKGAYSDFRGNYRDGFTRYELVQSGHESSALKIYSSLHGKTIDKYGPLYFYDGGLAYNMLFIPFYRNDVSSLGDKGLEKYYYLGYEMKKDSTLSEVLNRSKDKLIVIGDFENDKHQTYIGEVPGPLLTVRTYDILEKSSHRFSWICFSIMSIIYFLILYSLFVYPDLNDKICKLIHIRSNILAYLISLIGWGLILGVVKLAIYAFFGLAIVAWLPAWVFSTVSFVSDFRRYKSERPK